MLVISTAAALSVGEAHCALAKMMPSPARRPPGDLPREPIIIRIPPRVPEIPEIDGDEEEPDGEIRRPPGIPPEMPPPRPEERAVWDPVACGKLDEGPTKMNRLEPDDRARPQICRGMRRPRAARWLGEVWCAGATAR
jgi:hypothetical protein